MSGIGFDLNADASQVEQELRKVVQAQEKIIGSLKGQVRANQTARAEQQKNAQAEREKRKIEREGIRITKATQTAEEALLAA